jgi:hypothetical protein
LKSIQTLVEDVYGLFEKRPDITKEQADRFGENLAKIIAGRLGREDKVPALRMSMLGTLCLRKLWYSINKPELGEPLDGQTRLKFLYGDILECLLLFLAELSGHTVTGQQDELDIAGVKGHRDAIIDGVLVDVKSASPFGFKKFELHGMEQDDPFGYLDQINAYLFASQDDPNLKEKQKAAFFAVEKSMGKLTVDVYESNGTDYVKKIEEIRFALAKPEAPDRYYQEQEEVTWRTRKGVRYADKTGNLMLGMECSYCPFKFECWPGLQVRTNSKGPKFYTKLVKDPQKKVAVEAEDFNAPVENE